MQQLTTNTLLHGGTYKIVKMLGQGSFGITYLAEHTSLGKKVAIKEFFMKELNSRGNDGSISGMSDGSLSHNYGQKFKKEAINLSRLEHPNIVRVTDSFDENGTYYYVMDYIDGCNLNDYLKSNPVSQKEAVEIITDVAKALMYMHEEKHVLHLDLKPGNIMRRKSDGHIFLIDFGLSKHFSNDGQPETSTTIGLGTAGYAPIEQSNQAKNGEFRPTIDVYALGATLYKLLTGRTPPVASELVTDDELISDKLKEYGIEDSLASVVVNAMLPNVKKRIQTIRTFSEILENCTTSQTTTKSSKQEDSEDTVIASSPTTPPNAKGKRERIRGAGNNNEKPSPTYASLQSEDTIHIDAESKTEKGKAEAKTRTKAEAVRKVQEEEERKKRDAVIEIADGEYWSYEQLEKDIEAGGKFVHFYYVFSIIIFSFKNPSKVFYIKSDENCISKSWPFLLISLTLGWWGFPWGIVYTIQSIGKAFSGEDVTHDVMNFLSNGINKEGYNRFDRSSIGIAGKNNLVKIIAISIVTLLSIFSVMRCHEGQTEQGQADFSSVTDTLEYNDSSMYSTTEDVISKEAVDLNLPSGVKWANMNLGADNPWQFGGYYAWGGVEAEVEYDDYSIYHMNGKYIIVNTDRDAAHVSWGEGWRMPKYSEFEELVDKCTWEWSEWNGVLGYKVTGSNGNYIFLPAGGYKDNNWGIGTDGFYWSGELYRKEEGFAKSFNFNENRMGRYNTQRSDKMAIRPVHD